MFGNWFLFSCILMGLYKRLNIIGIAYCTDMKFGAKFKYALVIANMRNEENIGPVVRGKCKITTS